MEDGRKLTQTGVEAAYRPVARDDLELLLRQVEKQASDPCAGIFGPGSISWRVNRESAIFLGAGRAALLQLAHPWVATALEHHSNLRSDPLARFHNTFRVVFTMIFGTLDQALSASRHLHELHTYIQGRMPEPVAAYAEHAPYQANEVHALLWVFATLVDSGLMAYESVLPALTAQQREEYYSGSKTMAALFGIPQDALPLDWAEFQRYMESMFFSNLLGVNQLSRDLADGVLHGRSSWVPVPAWYRALTAAWLPERFLEEFCLLYGPREWQAQAGARRSLSKTYPMLPGCLRFVGPYHEAQSRLRGRRAGLLTRASNRFWMGVPIMMAAGPVHLGKGQQRRKPYNEVDGTDSD